MLIELVKSCSSKSDIPFAQLMALISVETGGHGFDALTGKILIQFEPSWFKKKAPYAPSGKWSVNGVERQLQEWLAFNDAFVKDANAAMESTSIGLPQIMGFHWKRLGYSSAGNMWDDFKAGLENQIEALIAFIKTDKRLHDALIEKDWHKVALYYNGYGYMNLAYKLGREPYNISLKNAYEKYKGV